MSWNKYQKVWIKYFGSIPRDDRNRLYEIHHIDGNRENNSIENLKCVSIIEHLEIHLKQKEYMAAFAIMIRLDEDEKQTYIDIELPKIAANQRDNSKIGFNNPNTFKKAIETQKKMIKEGVHPLQNVEMHKNENKRRVKLGIHNFQSNENKERVTNWNSKMIEQGKHPFQNSSNRSDWVLKFKICEFCGCKGRGIGYIYNHGDFCLNNVNNKRLICKFCGNSYHPAIYARYHGDKCKYKSKTFND